MVDNQIKEYYYNGKKIYEYADDRLAFMYINEKLVLARIDGNYISEDELMTIIDIDKQKVLCSSPAV